MKKYRLHQDIISPFIISNLRGRVRLEGLVNNNNEVIIDNRIELKIINDSLPENTIVSVYLDDYIYCNTQKDLENEKKKIKYKQKTKEQQLSIYKEKERKSSVSIVKKFFLQEYVDYKI